MTLTRRSFLLSSSAAALAATVPLPAMPVPKAAVGVDLAAGPDLLAFVVGTPGEYDWQVVFAKSARDALLEAHHWMFERMNPETKRWEIDPNEPVDVDAYADHFQRVPQWDGRDPAGISPADWFCIGWGYSCDRCDGPASADSGLIIGSDVVCEDCVTFADRVAAGDWDWIEDELANQIETANDLPDERERLDREGHLAAIEAAGVWSKVVARVEADA